MQCIRCHREIDPTFKACPHCGEAVTDFARRYSNELLDNKYRIVERLGTGGMGEVYKAIHTYLDAERVIKIVRASIAGSDEAHDRFLREAKLATKVQHPNVATLHDFAALPDGSHYMVWEYIDGKNLGHVLRDRGTLPPAEAVDITRQALEGLEAIHAAGIVHRDISPENLMITNDRRVKIIDLGVAKLDEPEGNLTKTGIFVGKLRYASPEHLGFLKEGARIDGRADLYSLAIVLYETLTGRPPFEATSPHQYLLHHSTAAEAKPADLTRVPAELRPVLARALERDREKRYPTARAFADALRVPVAHLPAADADATMRVTPEPPTIRTPLPATVIDTAPAPPPAPRRRSTLLIVAPILIIAIVAVMWAMRPRTDVMPQQQETPKTSTTTQAAVVPPPSQTTIDVTTTTAAPTPAVTTTTATPPPQPAPVTITHPEPAPAPVPAPQPEPQPVAVSAATYTENGDGDANSAAVEKAKAALAGVTKVSVVNSGGDEAQAQELIKNLTGSGIEVGPGADVTIQFNGVLDHPGRKKRRTVHATVLRHGRAVFRYELPSEEYRVGDTPAEAFARVLRDVLEK